MSTDWCSKRYEALLSRALDLIEMFLYNAANGNSMEYQPISAAESFLNEVDAMQQELEDQKCDASYWSNLNEIVNPDLERLINNAREGIRSDDEFSEVEMPRLVELCKGAGLEKRGRSWYPQKSQIQLGFGREAPPASRTYSGRMSRTTPIAHYTSTGKVRTIMPL